MLTPDHSASYLSVPDHVAVVVLKGVVTEYEVRAYIDGIKQKLATHEAIGVVVDVSGWSDITQEALRDDLRLELSMLGEMHRCPRIAVVSDKTLVAALGKIIGPLVPSKIGVFASGEEKLALDFATDITSVGEKEHGAIKSIDTHRSNLLAFEINGTATTQDVQRVSARLLDAFDKFESIDLLVRIKDYGFDPQILNMDSWMALKTQSFRHVRRYAVVGSKDWMKTIINAINAFTNMDIRSFALDEEHLAWTWLGAEPKSDETPG